MRGLKSAVGLAVLSALLFSAFAAANASAAGTTAFTCKPVGTGAGFSDAHCKTVKAGGEGFAHVAIAENTETETKVTNIETGTTTSTVVFRATIGGIPLKFSATGLAGTGEATNKTVGGIMQRTGSGIKLTYTGVKVVEPPSSGCVVYDSASKGLPKETVTTETLSSTTIEGTGATATGVKFSPPTSGIFAVIHIEGCTNTALDGNFNVKGSAVGIPNGATLEFTAASTANLTFAGGVASLEGKATISAKGTGDSSFTPLALTTTTP